MISEQMTGRCSSRKKLWSETLFAESSGSEKQKWSEKVSPFSCLAGGMVTLSACGVRKYNLCSLAGPLILRTSCLYTVLPMFKPTSPAYAFLAGPLILRTGLGNKKQCKTYTVCLQGFVS